MNYKIYKIILYIALLSSFRCFAESNINKIDFTSANQLEISLTNKADFKIYTLTSPDRIVVDLIKTSVIADLSKTPLPFYIEKLRFSQSKEKTRIVFDLKDKVNIKSSKIVKNKDSEFSKIIINVEPQTNYVIKNIEKNDNKISNNKIVKINKKPIIVIDAGHGGKDPGTIGGFARTKEKNITLSYSKELAKHLMNSKKYEVFLTRDSDFFIPLKQRVSKARNVKADLFISLHANAAEDNNAKGFSIYTLSEKASDKQSEILANKENRADIISGINFQDTSADILKTLIDMSQRNSMNHSSRFANIVIKTVRSNEIFILHNTHRFAGFAVLTAPDMVSVLVELGYLSNSLEEKDLNSISHKRKIVKGLVEAIDEYFKFRK